MLKGMVVSISSGLCEEPEGGDDAAPMTFSKMKSLVQSLGATVSPTVHKRVNFLVCSDSAVDRNTQKVRKARKFHVKVVTVEYLHAVQREKKRLALDPYVIEPSEDEEQASEEEKPPKPAAKKLKMKNEDKASTPKPKGQGETKKKSPKPPPQSEEKKTVHDSSPPKKPKSASSKDKSVSESAPSASSGSSKMSSTKKTKKTTAKD